MVNDIDIIGVLLPYCDAMFVDKECAEILKQIKNKINFSTKIYSLNNKNEFIDYLNEIEKKTPKSHFEKVYEVYGKKWLHNYKSYENWNCYFR